jgi:NAD+ synthase
VAVSGGIDSSVTAALCARALGPDRVLGVKSAFENISPILEAFGCYRRRDEAFSETIPEFGSGWKAKIVLPSIKDGDELRFFSVVAVGPDGTEIKRRLTADAYLTVVAATNFKQRFRKVFEYYYADRLNYAVAGTPNRLEYDQGFFVKLGDGAADLKPIAHLYKTQVYQLSEYLGVPEDIRKRPPTTDTYSMQQSQEEFYFSFPHEEMDICLYAKNHGKSAQEAAQLAGLSTEQVERVYADIEQKRRTTRYLHASAQLMDIVPEAGWK